MEFLQPTAWTDAVAAKAEHPSAVPVAGGTDVMVELNFDRRRPAALLDLTRVPDLAQWWVTDDGRVRLGAGVTYATVITELADRLPGLAMAAPYLPMRCNGAPRSSRTPDSTSGHRVLRAVPPRWRASGGT